MQSTLLYPAHSFGAAVAIDAVIHKSPVEFVGQMAVKIGKLGPELMLKLKMEGVISGAFGLQRLSLFNLYFKADIASEGPRLPLTLSLTLMPTLTPTLTIPVS